MCGEKFRAYAKVWNEWGSPPHVRGKGCQFWDCQKGGEDHPRMCGEKSTGILVWLEVIGSPPRMRGKGLLVLSPPFCDRITPAHAGKSTIGGTSGLANGDHPRTCGEKSTVYPTMLQIEGSPPHVRGKEVEHRAGVAVLRITPACAGKSQGLNIFHTKRSSGPLPAAVPASPAGSCPASRPSQFPPRMTVISPRP